MCRIWIWINRCRLAIAIVSCKVIDSKVTFGIINSYSESKTICAAWHVFNWTRSHRTCAMFYIYDIHMRQIIINHQFESLAGSGYRVSCVIKKFRPELVDSWLISNGLPLKQQIIDWIVKWRIQKRIHVRSVCLKCFFHIFCSVPTVINPGLVYWIERTGTAQAMLNLIFPAAATP